MQLVNDSTSLSPRQRSCGTRALIGCGCDADDLDWEGIFAEQEQRAVKKATMDDVSYKAISSEAGLE
jgi:hypothetical protein